MGSGVVSEQSTVMCGNVRMASLFLYNEIKLFLHLFMYLCVGVCGCTHAVVIRGRFRKINHLHVGPVRFELRSSGLAASTLAAESHVLGS